MSESFGSDSLASVGPARYEAAFEQPTRLPYAQEASLRQRCEYGVLLDAVKFITVMIALVHDTKLGVGLLSAAANLFARINPEAFLPLEIVQIFYFSIHQRLKHISQITAKLITTILIKKNLFQIQIPILYLYYSYHGLYSNAVNRQNGFFAVWPFGLGQ